MKAQLINPFTEEVCSEFAELSPAELERAIEASEKSYASWSQRTLNERKDLCLQLAKVLEAHLDSLAILMTTEMGKRIAESKSEIKKCAHSIRLLVEQAESILKSKAVPVGAMHAEVLPCSQGVLLGIMPWNYPHWQVLRFAIPNLLLGNVIMIKHAPNVWGSAQTLEQIFDEAGFPNGVYRNLFLDLQATENLIGDTRIRGVSLTGSVKAGRRVAEIAGRALKKVVLELGGSDPSLVLLDADLALAAKKIAESRLLNSGQSCIAAKRVFVAKKVLEDFLPLLKLEFANLNAGNPLHESTSFAPLARRDLLTGFNQQVENSKKMGVKSWSPEMEIPSTGFFVTPQILMGGNSAAPCWSEEIFGPALAIKSFESEPELFLELKKSEFGLGASIYSKDNARATVIARKEMDSGMVFINDYVKSDARIPFGGVKNSGIGRELSREGFLEFANLKTIF